MGAEAAGTRARSASPSPRRRRARRVVFFALYAIVVALVLVEGWFRYRTRDVGGQATIDGVALLPYELVPAKRREILRRDPGDPSALGYEIPDPSLGWTIRPGGRSKEVGKDGVPVYAANALGLRTTPGRDVASPKPPGIFRVLAVGDSFCHGDEVAFEETWTTALERGLGNDVEVWNGGVPGYGTDQAVLRCEGLLPKVAPEVVVLTVYRQNLSRNLTFFRSLHAPGTGLPWSKPRFVPEGAGLVLRNVPVVPPSEVAAVLESYATHPLSRDDRFWLPGLYEGRALDVFRVYRYWRSLDAEALLRRAQDGHLVAGGEAVVVGERLVRRFVDFVRRAGATPLIAVLPDVEDVRDLIEKRAPRTRPLQEALLAAGFPVVDTGPGVAAALAPGERPESLYVRGVGHPNPRCCRAIAAALLAPVAALRNR